MCTTVAGEGGSPINKRGRGTCFSELSCRSSQLLSSKLPGNTTKKTFKLVLSSVLGLVFFGLFLIIVYRIVLEIYDRREFKRFEKERKHAKWNEVSAPSFPT